MTGWEKLPEPDRFQDFLCGYSIDCVTGQRRICGYKKSSFRKTKPLRDLYHQAGIRHLTCIDKFAGIVAIPLEIPLCFFCKIINFLG